MFFKKKSTDKNDDLVKIAALLIHAAKIDENYTLKEQEIIKKTLLEVGAKPNNLDLIIKAGKEIEENWNVSRSFAGGYNICQW